MSILILMLSSKEEIIKLDTDIVSCGRGDGNSIQLQDIKVSRKHCQIVKTPNGYLVRDLGSINGTFVNGQKIKEHLLREGDQIRIGSVITVFSNKDVLSTGSKQVTQQKIKPDFPKELESLQTMKMSATAISDALKKDVDTGQPKVPTQTQGIKKEAHPQPSTPSTTALPKTGTPTQTPQKSTTSITHKGTTSVTRTGIRHGTTTSRAIHRPTTYSGKRRSIKDKIRLKLSGKKLNLKTLIIIGVVIILGIVAYFVITQKPDYGPEAKKIYNKGREIEKDGRVYEISVERVFQEKALNLFYQAYEEFDKLLTKDKYKETKFVQDKKKEIESIVITVYGKPGYKLMVWGKKEKRANEEIPPFIGESAKTIKENARENAQILIDRGEKLEGVAKDTRKEEEMKKALDELKRFIGRKDDWEIIKERVNKELRPQELFSDAIKLLNGYISKPGAMEKAKAELLKLDLEGEAKRKFPAKMEEITQLIKDDKKEEALSKIKDVEKQYGDISPEMDGELKNKKEELGRSEYEEIKKKVDELVFNEKDLFKRQYSEALKLLRAYLSKGDPPQKKEADEILKSVIKQATEDQGEIQKKMNELWGNNQREEAIKVVEDAIKRYEGDPSLRAVHEVLKKRLEEMKKAPPDGQPPPDTPPPDKEHPPPSDKEQPPPPPPPPPDEE